MALSLSDEALDALFPTFVAVDAAGCVTRSGRLLRRLLPSLRAGEPLAAHFRSRPRHDLQAPRTWTDAAPVLLERLGTPRFVLRGQFRWVGDEVVHFNALVVRDLEQLQALDLHVQDLPAHDASIDGILAAQQERTSLETARSLERSLSEALAQEATERARLSTVVSSLTSGLLMEDASRRVSLVNQAFCGLFGIPVEPAALVGADCAAALDAAAPLFADPDAFRRRIEEILARSEPVKADELALADGRIFERDYLPLPLREGTGHLWWYRDVSEDRAIRRALAAARERAEVQDRRKTSFLAQTSHDLRTPLHVVVGVAELLGQEPLPAELRRHVRSLRGNAELLLSLVGEALDVASIEADRFRADVGPTDVRALADGLLDAFWSRATAKGLELEVDVEVEVPRLVAIDEARTRQIAANLVGNAIKFTPRGRVVLTFSHRDERLGILVEDTGPGIPEPQRVRIFEPFTQVEGTHERFGGTGLGLSIVRDLVGRLGGAVGVEESAAGGARFVVELPAPTASRGGARRARTVWVGPSIGAAARHALQALGAVFVDERGAAELSLVEPEQSTGAPGELVLGRDLDRPLRFADLRAALDRDAPATSRRLGRLLVVEDDPHASVVLVTRLEREGWTVTLERGGHRALERLARERFDAIVSDLHMPGGDGLELARRFRAAERGRRTPMIAVTAHALSGVRETCLDAGFDDYLTKPVDFGRLLELLRRATERGPRVLVVDDDPAAVAVTSELVRSLGPAELRRAATQDEVRAEVARGPVDVALVDVGLGAEDGREVGRWLRERGVPVIWVTGDAASTLEGEVVLKPVRRARLAAAFEAALGVRRSPGESAVAIEEIEIDELVADLLPELVARSKERAREALHALEAQEVEPARRLGHDLKGTAGSYGVPTLGAIGAALEASARRAELDATRTQLESLLAALDALRWRPRRS